MDNMTTIKDGDMIGVYELKYTRDLLFVEKIEEIFSRRGKAYNQNLKVTERDNDILVEFEMNDDVDMFQSEDTKALLDLGYYISMIHPDNYDNQYKVFLLPLVKRL